MKTESRPPLSELSFDLYAHQNPAMCAWITYWAAKGHEQQSRKMTGAVRGLLLPWAMLATGLLATGATRDIIPASAAKQLGTVVDDLYAVLPATAAPTIRSWADPTWRGIAFAGERGMLSIEKGVLSTQGRMKDSKLTPVQEELKKKALAFGKILAKEPTNATIAAAFNVEAKS